MLFRSIVKAGEKIGLMIFSSDRDFTLWPDPGTILTVDLNQTQLDLPVVGGTAAFQQAIEVSDAQPGLTLYGSRGRIGRGVV